MLLTVSVLLAQSRMDGEWASGVLLAVAALPAALILALGLQPYEVPRPPAFQSVLLLAGLLLAIVALFRLAEALGVESTTEASVLTWVFGAFGAAAVYVGVRRTSAMSVFVGALSLGAALLSAWQWLFEPDGPTAFRWLLLVLAVAYVLVSLALRGPYPRHAELLVCAAGIAILGIAVISGVGLLIPFGGFDPLPDFFELVLLVSGCGLLAYAAADRVPGPAYLGVAVLAAFVLLTVGFDATLKWWPLLLALVGLAAMGAGLRPRRPLPPEPATGAVPAAARSEAPGETVIRVRDES